MIIPENSAMACSLRTKHNASLSYGDVESAGPPVPPLDFPTPRIRSAERIDDSNGGGCGLMVVDHRTGRPHEVKNVVVPSAGAGAGAEAVAYAIRKKLAKSAYGSVYVCNVLRRRQGGADDDDSEGVEDELDRCPWVSSDEYVALKVSSFQRIREVRNSSSRQNHRGGGSGNRNGGNVKDPLKEAAVLQLLGNYHPGVLGSVDAFRDDDWLYTVMPYCCGGSLYGWFTRLRQKSLPPHVWENQARLWFRQLAQGLFHLQNKGVCHRDLSLENLLIDRNNHLTIADFGLALRVPYTDTMNFGAICDVSEGFGLSRRLMRTAAVAPAPRRGGGAAVAAAGHQHNQHSDQAAGGNASYVAPEILNPNEHRAFDGYAVDLWSAGVVLFIMLVGRAPFRVADPSDLRYRQISGGGLRAILKQLKITISDSAGHLLQNMLWADPRKRLTLSQVMNHPWVVDDKPVAFSSSRGAADDSFDAYTSRDAPSSGSDSTPTKERDAAIGVAATTTDAFVQQQQPPSPFRKGGGLGPEKASLLHAHLQLPTAANTAAVEDRNASPTTTSNRKTPPPYVLKALKAGRFQFTLPAPQLMKGRRIFSSSHHPPGSGGGKETESATM